MLFAYSSGKEKIKSYWKIHFIPFLFIHETISLCLASAAAKLFRTLRVYLGCRVNRFTSPWHDFARSTASPPSTLPRMISISIRALEAAKWSEFTLIRNSPSSQGDQREREAEKREKYSEVSTQHNWQSFFAFLQHGPWEKGRETGALLWMLLAFAKIQTREREEQHNTST